MNPTTMTDTIVEEIAIRAGAERVFDALTDPRERMKWWGSPEKFGVTECESDLRPGGKWHMRGNAYGGRRFEVIGEYREIERPRLLMFTWLPDWYENAAESLVRWDLEEKDGVTTVRVTHSGLNESGRQSHRGWSQILVWLRDYAEKE